jgi:hypothetical protein
MKFIAMRYTICQCIIFTGHFSTENSDNEVVEMGFVHFMMMLHHVSIVHNNVMVAVS